MIIALLLKNENDNFNVRFYGNKINEVNDQSYQAAESRAKEVIQNKKESGYIIIDKNDGAPTVKKV